MRWITKKRTKKPSGYETEISQDTKFQEEDEEDQEDEEQDDDEEQPESPSNVPEPETLVQSMNFRFFRTVLLK